MKDHNDELIFLHQAMSILAIVALSIIALTLIPAIILITPTPSRVGDRRWNGRTSDELESGAVPAPEPAARAERVAMSERRRVEAPIDFDATSGHARSASARYHGGGRRFMLTPQPEKPRRFVPHSDGFADVPLCFTDGRGSHYTTRWRLCIN